MTMRNTKPPDFDTVAKDLQPLIDLAVEAFERGTVHARDYFQERNKRVDITLFNDLVRFWARDYLNDKGQFVEVVYQTADIANIGLSLTFDRYSVRIWKAKEGEIPPPGRSRAKHEFLNQFVQAEMEFPGLPRPVELNLALLWRMGPGYQFKGLELACPRATNGRYSPVDIYWSEPVGYSALIYRRPVETAVGQPVEEDLPFEALNVEEGGSERSHDSR